MRAEAFSPGHITGFFQICEHEDPIRTGSRGAGICINRGATSHLHVKRGKGRIRVKINGKEDPAPVTKQALAALMEEPDLDISVETHLDLPVCQGFGMSAAGALSAALALADILGRDRNDALEAVHVAEILHRSGLGDVAGISTGGVGIRIREGIPPSGKVMKITQDLELIIAVVGPSIPTRSILSDMDLRRRINSAGSELLKELLASPSLANFFRVSREFTERTGLMTREVELALSMVDNAGPASMVMLGNSIFLTGDLETAHRELAVFDTVHRVRTDWMGPRVLDSTR